MSVWAGFIVVVWLLLCFLAVALCAASARAERAVPGVTPPAARPLGSIPSDESADGSSRAA